MAEQKVKPTGTKLPVCECCSGSGWFSDFDVDFGSSRFGTCTFCGGTGRAIELSRSDRQRLSDLRTMRDGYQGYTLRRLKNEALYMSVFDVGRATVLKFIDGLIAAFESGDWIGSERKVDDAFRTSLEFLDAMLPVSAPYSDQYPGFEWGFDLVRRHCGCRQHRAELMEFVRLVDTLPDSACPDGVKLCDNIHALQAAWTHGQGWRDAEWVPLTARGLFDRGDGFARGLDALLDAQRFLVEHPDVRVALEHSACGHENDSVGCFWDMYVTFHAGLYGGSIRSMLQEVGPRRCICQQFRARLQSAREALAQLIPEKGSEEGRTIIAALSPHKERVQREIARVEAWLAQRWPIEELWLMVLMHAYWVQAGKPKDVVSASALDHLHAACYPMPKRTVMPEERARFILRDGDVPNRLNGLTPELLADLHDCVQKFGVEDDSKPLRRLSLREPKEMHVAVSTKRENRGIFIVGPGGVTSSGADCLGFVGDPQAIVIWDNRVTLDDIASFINHVDHVMMERGCVSERTFKRTRVVSEHAPSKLRVADVFATVGACMPALPGGPDAETLRQQFDHPEDLFVFADPLGGQSVCHTRDREYVEERSRVATRVLASRGFATHEDLARLSLADVLKLRTEIEQQLPRG